MIKSMDQLYFTSKQFQFFDANVENKEKSGKQKSTGILWNKGENATLSLIVSKNLYKGKV